MSCLLSSHQRLPPIAKWPGGKTQEIAVHLSDELFPETAGRIFDPFVGGGSVFLSLDGEEFFINDISQDLMALYAHVKSKNELFFSLFMAVSADWEKAACCISERFSSLRDAYLCRDDNLVLDTVSEFHLAISHLAIIAKIEFKELYTKTVKTKLSSRLNRFHQDRDESRFSIFCGDIETTIKTALYYLVRKIYNDNQQGNTLRTFAFAFLREYGYSSTFRFNAQGDFNVAYGGSSYNKKNPIAKMKYWKSSDLQLKLDKTQFSCDDFENMLRKHAPSPSDFVFLDPPYDSKFSSYVNSSFSRDDHLRLSRYLINECQAKWMMVIKNTDFISSIYRNDSLSIIAFDKMYNVNIQGRNKKSTKHLIIRNYQ